MRMKKEKSRKIPDGSVYWITHKGSNNVMWETAWQLEEHRKADERMKKRHDDLINGIDKL